MPGPWRAHRKATKIVPFAPAGAPTMFSRPFWDLGFRPFFLLGAGFAALWVPLWVLMYWGQLPFNNYLLGYDWHMHEMVFGFVAAAIAGFLLTAVRNWTRRPTLSGGPLAMLALLWLAGRVAVLLPSLRPGTLPPLAIACIDVAFLPLLAAAIARPIVAARNWRNVGFVPLLLGLALLNGLMHAKALRWSLPDGWPTGLYDAAPHVAVDLVLIFLSLIGGRIVPAFTRNATPGMKVERSAWADRGIFGLLLLLAIVDGFDGARTIAAAVALAAGVTSLWRMRGWGWRHSLTRPVLWVLHLGYGWIGVGLMLKGVAGLLPALERSAATHALTVGAMATFVLGMMTRVALGHTGRTIEVHRAITIAYHALTAATLLRVVGSAWQPSWYAHSLVAAASLWGVAFVIYLVVYLPILLGPRADGTRDWRQAPA
jgi:uncharacterized protein involved in response to NO